MSKEMLILAEVQSFTSCAVHDNLEDGSLVTYDASDLRVISPNGLEGETIWVIHSTEVPQDSPWRASGVLLSIVIDREHLSDERQLYDGAIKHLRIVAPRDVSTPTGNR